MNAGGYILLAMLVAFIVGLILLEINYQRSWKQTDQDR